MSYFNCRQGGSCEDCNGYIGPLDTYACLCSCHTRESAASGVSGEHTLAVVTTAQDRGEL